MEKRKAQVVIIAKTQLLLLETSKSRGDNFWQNVTGSIEENEDFLIGAIREVFEETGISAQSLIDLGLVFNFIDRFNKNVREKCYLLYLSKTPEVKISEEHQNYRWIDIANVKDGDFKFSSNFEAFKKSLEIMERYKA